MADKADKAKDDKAKPDKAKPDKAKPVEEPEGAETETAAPKGRFGGKKMLLIAGAGAFVLLAAGVGAAGYMFHWFGLFGDTPPPKAEIKNPAIAVYHTLPDMLVNLSGTGKRNNFLKIKISLEVGNPQDLDRVKLLQPRVVDNFQTYLRDLRVDDLQGAQGMYRLREELLMRINVAVAPAKVTDILFQEMLVQVQ